MKSLIAKTMPVVLGLSLMAAPASAQDPSADGDVAPASIAVDSFIEATAAGKLLEGRIFLTEVNESNRMCAAFRKVKLYKMTKTKSGWKGRMTAWDATTADGAFRFRLDEGVWSVKAPRHTYFNADDTQVSCSAVKLAKRMKVV